GGWKQRLALGACTLPNPHLLLLDEPTAGVDPKARRDFWNEIHALAARGLTVLVSTHYMDEAERCHEIAYIAYGHLLAHGTVDEVIAKSALSTWTVSGDDLNGLAAELAGKPGVDMVAPFGTSLHVSGLDKSVLKALENTSYFRFTREVHSVAEFDELLQSGKVLFAVEIPRGFERAVRRGDRPALLVAADATDPVASGTALGSLGVIVQTALA